MRIAAITTVRDGTTFLPLWISHYGAMCGVENLFVMDHGSVERPADVPGCNYIRLPRTTLDEQVRADSVSRMHASLLGYYDAVIYSDADELIVVDQNDASSIQELLTRTGKKTLAALGLNVIHLRDDEPDIDLSQPILVQRRWVRFDPGYVKVVVSSVPVNWRAGFHGTSEPWTLHGGLYLSHLCSFDWKTFQTRHVQRMKTPITGAMEAQGIADHYGWSLEKAAQNFFFDGLQSVLEDQSDVFDFTDACRRFMVDGDMRRPRDWPTARVPDRLATSIGGVPSRRLT